MASTADTTSGHYRNGIEPLKGAENYLSWSVQIQDLLDELGLTGYVDGTITRPTEAAELATWKTKDRKALTAIRLRISSLMISHVLSSTTSKDAWDSLKNVFNTQGPLARILARRKFLRFSIKEGASLEEEIRRIRQLKEELTLLGSTIADDEFTLTILTALPAFWDPFISSIGSTVPSSSDVIGRILAEDNRRKDRSGPEQALYGRAPAKKSKYRPGVYCHNCGNEGHIRPECRSPPTDSSGTAGKRFKARAHMAQPNEYEDQQSEDDDSSDDYVFATIEPATRALIARGAEVWLADSACTRHIVRDRALFTTFWTMADESSIGIPHHALCK